MILSVMYEFIFGVYLIQLYIIRDQTFVSTITIHKFIYGEPKFIPKNIIITYTVFSSLN